MFRIICKLSWVSTTPCGFTSGMVLLRRTKERRELPNGYSLRFAAEGDVLAEIARTVDNERKCCRLLRFAVTVEPDNGPITVDLTGPPGTREFLAAMFDL